MRVFSGCQPTGSGLHLGNFLGAIKHFVNFQKTDAECLFCVVDMHAITIKHDPKVLAKQTREIAAAYLACGIDPEKSIIFVQSQVPAHAEMAWILNSVARIGWLERMTQFREKTNSVPPANLREILSRVKSELDDYALSPEDEPIVSYEELSVLYKMLSGNISNQEKASVGLFTYPVLMAADILSYKATHVPVGADQKQHLNLARDIAQKFNNDYQNEFFPIPEAFNGSNARVMSLQDASKKMSKSDPDILSRIDLSDSDEMIHRKIRRATADTLPFPSCEEEVIKPEIENLINIFSAVGSVTRQEIFEDFGGKGYGNFKPALGDALVRVIAPIRTEMQMLRADPKYLDGVLRDGAEEADFIARPILRDTKKIVGYLV